MVEQPHVLGRGFFANDYSALGSGPFSLISRTHRPNRQRRADRPYPLSSRGNSVGRDWKSDVSCYARKMARNDGYGPTAHHPAFAGEAPTWPCGSELELGRKPGGDDDGAGNVGAQSFAE
jgi:hypothetical protein